MLYILKEFDLSTFNKHYTTNRILKKHMDI